MIHLFGVDGAYLGRREHYQKQFDFGHSAVRTAIEKTWSDHFGEGTTYHVPRPQPTPEPGDPDMEHFFVLVDFLPVEDPMHLGKVAALADGTKKKSQFDDWKVPCCLKGPHGWTSSVILHYKTNVCIELAINVSCKQV